MTSKVEIQDTDVVCNKGANDSHFTVFQSCLNTKLSKFYLMLLCVNFCKRMQKNKPIKQKMNRNRNRIIYEYNVQ